MTTSKNSGKLGPEPLKPGLYIIATPIGNLGDITLRAIDYLRAVRVIYAEDTRHASLLLSAHGVDGSDLRKYHEHSTTNERDEVSRLAKECAVALVSDAGTPLISDPGYKLVAQVLHEGAEVFCVPGASSVTAALSVCGLPTDSFAFFGFYRKDLLSSRKVLDSAVACSSLVFFVPGRDICSFLEDIELALSPKWDVRASVCRELTKVFESVIRGTVSQVLEHFLLHPDEARGEAVAILSLTRKGRELRGSATDIVGQILEDRPFLSTLPTKALCNVLIEYHPDVLAGFAKKEVYGAVVKLCSREPT